MILRFCFLFCLLLNAQILLRGQEQKLQFNNEALISAIQKIEKQSNLTFNYDPNLLQDYKVEGALDLSNPNGMIRQLLYQTPFHFEQSSTTILIYLPQKHAFNICGHILDQETGKALPYATILLDGLGQGTQTDENGYFELQFDAFKNQNISLSYIGYESISLMAQQFSAKQCKTIHLKLNEALFGSPIIVTDYILNGITEGETYSSTQMDYQVLAKEQLNIEHDILRSAQLVPGISSINGSATNLQIRGGTADQNLILWEGATLYDPGHFFGMISAINPFVVDKVEIFKGVHESSYDNRVGGIIDMSLSDSIPTKTVGGFGSTLSEAHGYLNIPIIKEHLSILVSGRNTTSVLFESPTLVSYGYQVFQDSKVTEDQEEEEEQDQLLNYYDWNAKLLFRPSDQLLLKASLFRSANAFNYFTSFENTFESNDILNFESEAVSMSLQFRPSQNWTTEFRFNQSRYTNDYAFTFSDIEEEEVVEGNNADNDIFDQSFSIANKWYPSENTQIQFGYQYNRKEVNFNYSFYSIYEVDFIDINYAEAHFHNPFASLQYNQDHLQLNAGIRAIYYEEAEKWSYSPRLNLQYVASDHLKFKASAGILQQYISQLREFGHNELGINIPVWVISRAETEDNQEARKLALGFLFHQSGWLLDMEWYRNKTTGLNTLSPVFRSNTGLDDDFSSGQSTATGLDLLLKKNWKNYHFWFNYSLSSTTFLFPEIEEFPFSATNDQRHRLSIVNSFLYKNWSFSLMYQYKSALPYTSLAGVEAFYEEEVDETFYELEYEAINEGRLNPFSRLDFGISYKQQFKNSPMQAEYAFSVLNILNRENIFSRNYLLGDFEGDDDLPEELEISRILIGRTPQLLIRFHW